MGGEQLGRDAGVKVQVVPAAERHFDNVGGAAEPGVGGDHSSVMGGATGTRVWESRFWMSRCVAQSLQVSDGKLYLGIYGLHRVARYIVRLVLVAGIASSASASALWDPTRCSDSL